ncbi:5'-AMP-activated serine/threonine-protein kinase catalytic subunit alpha-like [Monomorium pharaonis]|uniref:5'-AMP-activated serine/threonine-protein kinase catalytic subunit alpha-like n=1 Tax=Monomorium pharaonis TaxID=307658 RepID=UPI001747C335|nr:5'-AMP-activated serine/threonine-protein kinase catalytic subunit alpha-like [Monomorium pharaonis]
MQHLERKHTLHLHPKKCNVSSTINKENIDNNNTLINNEQSTTNNIANDNEDIDMDVDDPNVPSCSYNTNNKSNVLKPKIKQQKTGNIENAFQQINSFKEGGTQCN